ncbi:alcohol dehydrogenase catalytic domain-containing protein [Rhodococcus aetherivorans]|uniref:alcohol dehydrogenase catalytic domain-containing protein n=1 Tax=Rhodococcus aetherivorans TaxID=191292 RepID=UPI001E46A3E6|nr:alcohol dehydrogenase catalytic domain-containing protein [Rhodococcus aetherivorans]UGQ42359.1 alcohol dehydrogenase catalytic domain-containing protein [Rhodococcus aetherivorans]
MRAAVSRRVGQIEIEELPDPRPRAGEVRVRLVSSGICHTDVSVLAGHLPSPRPIVLGHEGAGIVDEVGPGVEHLAVGDHVLCSIITSCHACYQCLRGEYALCECAVGFSGNMLDGTTRLRSRDEDVHTLFCQGSFAEYAVVPASAAVKIRPDAPLEKLAGLGCAWSTGLGAAIVRAEVRPGSNVVVIGAGGVGLAAMMGARAMGATSVIAVDLAEHKLARARELGLASHTISVSGPEAVAAIRDLTDGRGADYGFDAVGAQGTLETALQGIRPGGLAVAIGVMDASVTVTSDLFAFLMQKQLTGTYAGSIIPQRDIPAFVDLYMDGRLPLDSVIDATYGLDDVPKALGQLAANEITKGVVLL